MADGFDPRRVDRRARDALIKRVKAEETHCFLCGGIVDKSLPYTNPGAPEVHELIPVSLGGDPLDRDNVRLTHKLCNQKQGNKRMSNMGIVPSSFPVSREW